MKAIRLFKDQYDDTEFNSEENCIHAFNKDGDIIATLDNAEWHIEDFFEGYRVETLEFTNPLSKDIYLSGEDAVKHLGGYADAYNTI